MPAASIISFRSPGWTTWTSTSISSRPAPRRRRAGRRTDWRESRVRKPAAEVAAGFRFHTAKAKRARRPSARASDRPVQPLVVERAAHGGELVAEFLGMRRGNVGVVGALVLPDFDH